MSSAWGVRVVWSAVRTAAGELLEPVTAPAAAPVAEAAAAAAAVAVEVRCGGSGSAAQALRPADMHTNAGHGEGRDAGRLVRVPFAVLPVSGLAL